MARRFLKRGLIILLSVAGIIFSLVVGFVLLRLLLLPDVDWLATEFPKTTRIMKHNGDEDTHILIFVPLEKISPRLIKAVLLSEDIDFFRHKGIDWEEMKLALRQNWERKKFYRGGSTITMQLAKNLFLSPSKNPLRKLEEFFLTRKMEKKLSKKRILELYLNLVEWGPHIYGAEASARHHFGVSASELTSEQACALAAILPSPKRWNPNKPTKTLVRRIERLKAKYDTFPVFIPEDLREK